MIIAGVVLFNPDITRLNENIKSVINQIDKMVLIDNGSLNYKDIVNCIEGYKKCKLIKNKSNLGIATALNQIVEYAYKQGCEWLLTLDQDSICQSHLLDYYKKYMYVENVALMSCNIKDRNFSLEEDKEWNGNFNYIKTCITSGSFLNIKKCIEVGGFDDKMFIDRVDTDMCYTLVEYGYKIIKVNYTGLLHEVGNKTRTKRICGKEVVIFNHSAFRSYYIIRNGIYFVRKHKKHINVRKTYLSVYRRILVFVFFEDDKWNKFKASIRGLIDGHMMKISNSHSNVLMKKFL